MRLSNLHTTGVKKKKKKKYFLFYSINHYSIEYFPITSLVKSKSLHTWTLERAREEELKVLHRGQSSCGRIMDDPWQCRTISR